MTDVCLALEEDAAKIIALAESCAEAPDWNEMVWAGVISGAPVRACFVARSEGKVIGFAVVSCVDGIAELESVAVAEGARRSGLGRALCKAAINWARWSGGEKILLEVRASSAGALALYGGLGFVYQGRRKRYYHDPVDDAVLMAAELGDGTAKV